MIYLSASECNQLLGSLHFHVALETVKELAFNFLVAVNSHHKYSRLLVLKVVPDCLIPESCQDVQCLVLGG